VTPTLDLRLPDDVLEGLAERVAARIAQQLQQKPESPWLTTEEAAAYLRWPFQRIYKQNDLPRRKHGNRLMFRRDELDDYLDVL